MMDDKERAIRNNIRIHDRVAAKYKRTHGEIFNPVEQARLKHVLEAAVSLLGDLAQKKALDFGCGTGNLTGHLLDLGLTVVAADVSPRSLALVRTEHTSSNRLSTLLLDGRTIPSVPDGHFDLVATYSVLHHVPDYLGAVREMMRVLKPTGILLIDHEVSPSYWTPAPAYLELRRSLRPSLTRRLLNLLRPRWYLDTFRRLMSPRYEAEGDIHVWPDDHIDWRLISEVVSAADGEVVREEDYLLYRAGYAPDLYRDCAARCADMRFMLARKRQSS